MFSGNLKPSIALFGACLVASPAFGQATAPSSVAPPSLRPGMPSELPAIALPEYNSLTAPLGSEDLAVALSVVNVDGGFPEISDEVSKITGRLLGRRVTLAEIYAAASAIEAAYARAGYVLVRVAIPPQSLVENGSLKIAIVDGFIEEIDLEGLPAKLRPAVKARVTSLIGKHKALLGELEQPLLIASEVPGLSITSTLTRGSQAGGVRLIIAGKHDPVSANIGADNALSASLGRYGVNAQISLNSLFGRGEQIYGFASSGYDITKLLASDNPVRVVGGGFVLPIGDGRFSLNPEATFARTTPLPRLGIPQTRGDLSRYTLRGSYTLRRTRMRSLVFNTVLEHVTETNAAPSFDIRLSRDRFGVARMSLGFTKNSLDGAYSSIVAQVSQGIGGRSATVDLGVSRIGSRPDFTKVNLDYRTGFGLQGKWQFGLTAKAQSTFGAAVFRSEQSSLEGSDASSAYTGSVTAVDEGATIRIELARPVTANGIKAQHIQAYGFAASGYGRLILPTAIEAQDIHAASLGVGLRVNSLESASSLPPLTFSFELSHGFTDSSLTADVTRFGIVLGWRL